MPRISEQEQPKNYTVARASRRLEVSQPTVWRRVKNGKIRIVRYGRSVRIPREELERLEREGF